MLGILQKEQQVSQYRNHHKQKKVKRQYSAGFRGYTKQLNQTINQKKQKLSILNNNDQIINLLGQLSIGNVKQNYQRGLPPKRQANHLLIQQSVNRLTNTKNNNLLQTQSIYNNHLINRQLQNSIDSSQRQAQQEQNNKKFSNTYHLQKNYKKKAKRNIILKQKQHQQEKLKNIYYQVKNFHKSNNFSNAFLQFIFCRFKQITSKSCPFTADTLGIIFKNFLLNSQYQFNLPKRQTQVLTLDQINKICNRSLFIYCFFRIPQLQVQTKESFSFNELIQLITKNKQDIKISQDILLKFQQTYEFTVPYDFHLYQIKKRQQKIQQPFQIIQSKATPIPKTLYQRPKSAKQKNQTKHQIQMKPFSFADKKQKKITPQEYYHWQTSFKANPIPKSTYQTTNPLYNQEGNQVFTKQRAKKLLQTAKYPESMKYLQNYNQYKEDRNHKYMEQHKEKYKIPHHTTKSKSIPNFNRLHAINILKFEQIKDKNKKDLKIMPFNFQQPKPKINKTFNVDINHDNFEDKKQKINYKKKQEDQPVKVNSTKKYEALVEFRKKGNQQKNKKKQQKEYKKKQQQKTHQPFRDILKTRMKDELLGTVDMKNRKHNTQQQLTTNMVKLNVQQIYEARPLLMESHGIKKQQIPFTQYYKPII